MGGYQMPAGDSPTYATEMAHLAVLRSFFALFAVRWPGQPIGLLVRQHWLQSCPEQGLPSRSLSELGIARPGSEPQLLQQKWLESLSAQQAAQYLSLLH
jgi:hypothetical protein